METLKIFENVLGYTEMYYFEEEKKLGYCFSKWIRVF